VVLFGIIFACFGLFFAAMLLRDIWRNANTYFWNKVPCTIVESSIERTDSDQSHPYHLQIRFRHGNSNSLSDTPALKPLSFSEYSDALRILDSLESLHNAWENPHNPEEAILFRGAFWNVFALLFPAVFILIGVGLSWAGLASKKQNSKVLVPTSKKKSAGVLFFGIFLLAGLAAFIPFFARPLFKIIMAGNWPSVPCIVESSQLQRHSGDEGSTYKIDILYSYSFNGRPYQSSRYQFLSVSSSGYAGKQAVINLFPPGSIKSCYVNPSDPYQAVLNRGFTPELLFGLIPLVFIMVGLVGVRYSLRYTPQADEPVFPSVKTADEFNPLTLKPLQAPATRFFVLLGVALFWNGFTIPFFLQWLKAWRNNRASIWLGLFLSIFLSCGAFILFLLGQAFLQLFSPKIILKLSKSFLRPGENALLSWTFPGSQLFSRLEIDLVGQELNLVQDSDSSSWRTSDISVTSLFKGSSSLEVRQGSTQLHIPSDAIKSSQSSNRQTRWIIRVKGEIPRWPDTKDEYPIIVV
jgi:hypothetical protein